MNTEEKHCPKCHRTLPTEQYYKHRSHADGLSSHCKECTKAFNNRHYHESIKHDLVTMEERRKRGMEWYWANRDRSRQRIGRNHREQREKAIAAYGGRCECCGESRYEFLSLDHEAGGGTQQRKVIGGKMARWLAAQGFPKDCGIRVLCHNCNMALGMYGYCPHQRENRGEVL